MGGQLRTTRPDQSDHEVSTDLDAERGRDTIADSTPFRLGRLLYGGILAFMALDNLRDLDQSIQYAESRGAPFPERSVPGASLGLLFGGLGVALWQLPTLAASAAAGFFVAITPVMHDFWNIDDPERKQQQLIHFLKNSALLGAALAFLSVGRQRSAESRS